jgi:hypothetical protein
MKIIVIGILVVLSALSGLKAQGIRTTMPVDPETKLITYKEVVQVSGKPDVLFTRAIEWVNAQYKNPINATKTRNPATGVIEILHKFEITRMEKNTRRPAGMVDYYMKIEFRDNRYRYTITNFNLEDVSKQPVEKWLKPTDKVTQALWDDYLKQVDDTAQKLISTLKLAMLPPVPPKKDEW